MIQKPILIKLKKKERNLLIEQLFVNPPNNNKIIHSEVNEDENDE